MHTTTKTQWALLLTGIKKIKPQHCLIPCFNSYPHWLVGLLVYTCCPLFLSHFKMGNIHSPYRLKSTECLLRPLTSTRRLFFLTAQKEEGEYISSAQGLIASGTAIDNGWTMPSTFKVQCKCILNLIISILSPAQSIYIFLLTLTSMSSTMGTYFLNLCLLL